MLCLLLLWRANYSSNFEKLQRSRFWGKQQINLGIIANKFTGHSLGIHRWKRLYFLIFNKFKHVRNTFNACSISLSLKFLSL